MDTAAANTRAARALVRGLARSGVRDACITPGSRSTPLTVAFADQTTIHPWLHLDERSSGFFALGLARATGRPVAIVCTSGTAAANLHPAVAEAHLGRVPLVVLTADRPPALRTVGAAQTIEQVRLFGASTPWAFELPLPIDAPGEAAIFEAFAERATRLSLGTPAGPVHLNVPFEEPLLALPAVHPLPELEPAVRPVTAGPAAPSPVDLEEAAQRLARSRRPLIVAGPESGALPADLLTTLARRLDAPILADPLSGVRIGSHDRTRVLDSYDAVVRDPRAHAFSPDAVLRLGAIPTSKALGQFLSAAAGAEHVLVDAPGSWRDPFGVTTAFVAGDAGPTLEALLGILPAHTSEDGWTDGWLAADARARAAMQAASATFADHFEGRVFPELQAALSPGATIVVGNSMPVRDADAFLVAAERPLTVVGNRGANGIDGVVSSALGASAAGTGPIVLVIGDLSFYHDLNGLWAAGRHGLNLTVVLVNNGGGAIFHYLPQAAHDAVFEEWFVTPSGLDFAKAVDLYGGRHVLVEGWESFRAGLAEATSGLTVLEVRADRAANVAMHRRAWSEAAIAAWSPVPVGP